MAVERTFSIVKPDAVAQNVIGEIYSRFEKGGLRIVASKMLHLTKKYAIIIVINNLTDKMRCPVLLKLRI